MGRFQSLGQVGLVLAEVIGNAVPATTDIRLNVPLEQPDSAAPAVRISLLWTTPQPSHRNDPDEVNADGTLAPPPPTLSVWYAISTYGTTDDQNAIGAHDLLGQIIRAFHIQPTLQLPIDGLGEGRLNVCQTPLDAELSEKIWVPFQVRHRPWALFDVKPVQLLRTEALGPEQPIVHPGGIRFGAVEVIQPPRIQRITPSPVGQGGRVRIDATYPGAPARVVVGETRLVPPAIAAMTAAGPVLATLPVAVTAGAYDVTLTGDGNVSSNAVTLAVIDAARPSLDAPTVLRHMASGDLVLEGRALGAGAVNVTFWPDAGISAPDDVVTVTGTAAGTSIVITSAQLAQLRNTLYRISLQYSAHGFTPYVLLEITP